MATFGKGQNTEWAAQSAEALRLQRIVCVAAIFSLAALPLLLSVALSIWGA